MLTFTQSRRYRSTMWLHLVLSRKSLNLNCSRSEEVKQWKENDLKSFFTQAVTLVTFSCCSRDFYLYRDRQTGAVIKSAGPGIVAKIVRKWWDCGWRILLYFYQHSTTASFCVNTSSLSLCLTHQTASNSSIVRDYYSITLDQHFSVFSIADGRHSWVEARLRQCFAF